MARLAPLAIALAGLAGVAGSLLATAGTSVAAPPKAASRASPPEGFIEMSVAGVFPTEDGAAVILRDSDEKTVVPIMIGLQEALAIQLRLERKRYPRPLTHDLLDSVMKALGGELISVQVDDLRSGTFVATIFVKQDKKTTHFDARASDSIALALGSGAPIFVSRGVISQLESKKSGGEKESSEDELPKAKRKERAPDLSRAGAAPQTL